MYLLIVQHLEFRVKCTDQKCGESSFIAFVLVGYGFLKWLLLHYLCKHSINVVKTYVGNIINAKIESLKL